jgi:hypothetical protein
MSKACTLSTTPQRGSDAVNHLTPALQLAGAMSGTRRGFLSLAGAAAVGAVLPVGSSQAETAHPDAELITLCGQFIALHEKTMAAESGISPAQNRKMDLIVADICSLRAASETGDLARAKVLRAWWPDFSDEVEAGGCYESRILGALLRDLTRRA